MHEPQGEQRCTRQAESLADAIRDWFATHVLELNYTAGGLATFGGLLGRTDTGENNAQIIQSQVFVNSRGQIGYRSVVDTASAIGPAFVLTNAIGVGVSTGPQPGGYSSSTSSHFELNAALVPGINLDFDSSSVGTSFRVGADVGAAMNITVGDLARLRGFEG